MKVKEKVSERNRFLKRFDLFDECDPRRVCFTCCFFGKGNCNNEKNPFRYSDQRWIISPKQIRCEFHKFDWDYEESIENKDVMNLTNDEIEQEINDLENKINELKLIKKARSKFGVLLKSENPVKDLRDLNKIRKKFQDNVDVEIHYNRSYYDQKRFIGIHHNIYDVDFSKTKFNKNSTWIFGFYEKDPNCIHGTSHPILRGLKKTKYILKKRDFFVKVFQNGNLISLENYAFYEFLKNPSILKKLIKITSEYNKTVIILTESIRYKTIRGNFLYNYWRDEFRFGDFDKFSQEIFLTKERNISLNLSYVGDQIIVKVEYGFGNYYSFKMIYEAFEKAIIKEGLKNVVIEIDDYDLFYPIRFKTQ